MRGNRGRQGRQPPPRRPPVPPPVQDESTDSDDDTLSESGTVTEAPDFASVDSFQEFVNISKLKEKVILDQNRFIKDNYPAKRSALSAKLTVLVDKMWTVVLDENKRRDYANFVNFVMTFTELYYFAIRVSESEYKSGDRSYISCDLLDLFINYYPTIEECRAKESADITNFSDLLNIRNKIIEAIREHYDVGIPMLRGRIVEEPIPEHEERHFPFDYEWLSGTVTSGPFYHAFMKYLYVTRMYQIEISYRRLQIVAASRNLEDKDNLREFRILVPFHATNPYSIDKALKFNEDKSRVNYIRLHRKVYRDNKVRLPEINFAHTMEQFFDLCGKVRRKKARFVSDIVHCEIKSIKSKLRVIGVLSSMDALFLLLQRAYGYYIDNEKGFVGVQIPLAVYVQMKELYEMVEDDCCGGAKGNISITRKLEEVREEVQMAIENFYLDKLEPCFKYFEDQVVYLPSIVNHHYSISLLDYPSSIAQHAKKMVWHLDIQEHELCRLHHEVFRAREAYLSWSPIDEAGAYTINVCQGAMAFASNFRSSQLKTTDTTLWEDSGRDLKYASPDRYVYVRMMRAAHSYLVKYNAVPTHVDLKNALRTSFVEHLHGQTINRKCAERLGDEFSHIITIEFSLSEVKPLYQPLVKSTDIARKIAVRVVGIYMDYVCANMTNPPKRCCRLKNPGPIPKPTESDVLCLERSCIAFCPGESDEEGSDGEADLDETISEDGTSETLSETSEETENRVQPANSSEDNNARVEEEKDSDDSDADTLREELPNSVAVQPINAVGN